MICINCDVQIDAKFKFALKLNKCPACNGNIMPSEQLVAYNSLRELLAKVSTVDADEVATLVVANFELKQLFKQELTKSSEECTISNTEEKSVEVLEDVPVDAVDPEDEEYKKQQLAESKKILMKMREEAMSEAEDETIANEWGLGNANGVLTHGDVTQMRKKQSTDNILSGTTGAFRR